MAPLYTHEAQPEAFVTTVGQNVQRLVAPRSLLVNVPIVFYTFLQVVSPSRCALRPDPAKDPMALFLTSFPIGTISLLVRSIPRIRQTP